MPICEPIQDIYGVPHLPQQAKEQTDKSKAFKHILQPFAGFVESESKAGAFQFGGEFRISRSNFAKRRELSMVWAS
jgi:putative alpha-1,2-mannosidase